MESSPSTPATKALTAPELADRIKHLPAEARDAFHQFKASGDSSQLDPMIFAILEHFNPRPIAQPLAQTRTDSLLIDDLGFDSLAITEVVFFTEEMFGINISNEEIMQVRTLGDLRGFIQRKVGATPAI